MRYSNLSINAFKLWQFCLICNPRINISTVSFPTKFKSKRKHIICLNQKEQQIHEQNIIFFLKKYFLQRCFDLNYLTMKNTTIKYRETFKIQNEIHNILHFNINSIFICLFWLSRRTRKTCFLYRL